MLSQLKRVRMGPILILAAASLVGLGTPSTALAESTSHSYVDLERWGGPLLVASHASRRCQDCGAKLTWNEPNRCAGCEFRHENDRISREAEARRQRKAEAQRQREAEARRQRMAEAQRQLEAEAQRQRETEQKDRRRPAIVTSGIVTPRGAVITPHRLSRVSGKRMSQLPRDVQVVVRVTWKTSKREAENYVFDRVVRNVARMGKAASPVLRAHKFLMKSIDNRNQRIDRIRLQQNPRAQAIQTWIDDEGSIADRLAGVGTVARYNAYRRGWTVWKSPEGRWYQMPHPNYKPSPPFVELHQPGRKAVHQTVSDRFRIHTPEARIYLEEAAKELRSHGIKRLLPDKFAFRTMGDWVNASYAYVEDLISETHRQRFREKVNDGNR